jgi:hypothetical protein
VPSSREFAGAVMGTMDKKIQNVNT